MRIVSLAPSNTEILFALGAGDSLVGRTDLCDHPEAAKAVPSVGGLADPDIDKIIELAPDMVLTSMTAQRELAEGLEDKGLPVVHLSPRSLKGVFDSISEVGDIVDKAENAINLIKAMNWEFERLREYPTQKPRLYVEEWNDPLRVAGNWVPDVAEAAGAVYGLVKSGRPGREVSSDEVREYDPQVIVLSLCGAKADVSMVTGRKGWKGISAVKESKVFVFDDSLLGRPGPRLVLGCKYLSQITSSS